MRATVVQDHVGMHPTVVRVEGSGGGGAERAGHGVDATGHAVRRVLGIPRCHCDNSTPGVCALSAAHEASRAVTAAAWRYWSQASTRDRLGSAMRPVAGAQAVRMVATD